MAALSIDLVLREISHYLSPSDLQHFRSVNRNALAAVTPIYDARKTLSFNEEKQKGIKDFLAFLSTVETFCFRSLKISPPDLVADGFQTLIEQCGKNVTKLLLKIKFKQLDLNELLMVQLPNLESLHVVGIISEHRYLNEKNEFGLKIKHLRIDSDWDGDIGEKGSAVMSLVKASRRLESIYLRDCTHVSQAIYDIATAKKCIGLEKFVVKRGLDSRIWAPLIDCAVKQEFNSLKTLETAVSPKYIVPFSQFLLKQMALRQIWIKVDWQEPNKEFDAAAVTILNQLGKIKNLRDLKIMPLFSISVLKSCVHLNRLVLHSIFSPHIYGQQLNIRAIFNVIFGGNCIPLIAIKKLHLGIYQDHLGPDHEENLEKILQWFPKLEELSIEEIHANSIPSIWKCCPTLVKLSIELFIEDYDFVMDELFVGRETCRRIKSGEILGSRDNFAEPKISDLKELQTLQLSFGSVPVRLDIDGGAALRNKMSDVCFVYGIHICPKMAHFEFLNPNIGYRAFVNISENVENYNKGKLFDRNLEMGEWFRVLDPAEETGTVNWWNLGQF